MPTPHESVFFVELGRRRYQHVETNGSKVTDAFTIVKTAQRA